MNKRTDIPRAPAIGANDRLGFTLFMALALHTIFILGVGFTQSDASQNNALPSLDIILANSNSPEAPDKADYLAQANQKGGGNQEQKARPGAPVSAPTPLDNQGMSERRQQQRSATEIRIAKIFYITQQQADEKVAQAENSSRTQSSQHQTRTVRQQRRDIASLQAEIREITEAYARRPREIALTASTKEAVEAGYLAQWVNKIEHIGNLNYPAEAEVNNISGSLRLNVRINAAGKVIDVKVSRPSGVQILDQAARRIVKLAAPFAPFPAKLRDKAEQIVIVRTWEFKSNRLSTNDNFDGGSG